MKAAEARKNENHVPNVADAEAAVAAATKAIGQNEAAAGPLRERIDKLGEELDAVLAADTLDHERAEELEQRKKVAERELEHGRARKRGLDRKLEEANAALGTAKAAAEAEEFAEQAKRWNAHVDKINRWVGDVFKLAQEVPEQWGNRFVVAANNRNMALTDRLAGQDVHVDIPQVRWLTMPGIMQGPMGTPTSGPDAIMQAIRKVVIGRE